MAPPPSKAVAAVDTMLMTGMANSSLSDCSTRQDAPAMAKLLEIRPMS